MEKKTAIKVPDAYLPLLEDIRLLTADQNNPNRTTIKQQEQIWKSLQKYNVGIKPTVFDLKASWVALPLATSRWRSTLGALSRLKAMIGKLVL